MQQNLLLISFRNSLKLNLVGDFCTIPDLISNRLVGQSKKKKNHDGYNGTSVQMQQRQQAQYE
jgi:hypothetical protein